MNIIYILIWEIHENMKIALFALKSLQIANDYVSFVSGELIWHPVPFVKYQFPVIVVKSMRRG